MQKKYPNFDILQLAEYNGKNPFVLNLQQKFFNDNDFSLVDSEIVYFEKYNGSDYFINTIVEEIESGTLSNDSIAYLLNYTEYNQEIRAIKERLKRIIRLPLSDFENEYLIKNFRYCGYSFPRVEVEVGSKTEERIQKDKNIDRKIPTVKIDTIVAETDEWYHVSCQHKRNTIYFWVFKEEVGDLYERVYIENKNIDFDELYKTFKKDSLYQHQKDGVKYLTSQHKCFLYDTVGAGKTYTSIASSLAEKSKKTLIVCLSGKKIDWKRELAVWGQDSKIINGTNNWIDDDVKYTIINFDILMHYHEFSGKGRKPKDKEYFRPLLNERYDCIIVDEIQRIKNPKTKRSQVIATLTAQPYVKNVWGLSATPIEKNEDLYNVCRTLNISIGDLIYTANQYHFTKWFPKYEEFIKNYCFGFKVIPKDKTKKSFWKRGKKINGIMVHNSNTYELHQRIKHKQRRVRTEKQIEGFPEKIREKMWYSLSSKEQMEYDQLYENYLKMRFLNRKIDKIFIQTLRDISKAEFNQLDTLCYELIDSINLEKEKAKNFNDGHETIVIKYADRTIEKIENFIERKRMGLEDVSEEEIELKEQEYLSELESIANLYTYENGSRAMVEKIILRQYLAKIKTQHTISDVRMAIEEGDNCIIFTHFKEEFDRLAKGLKKHAVLVKSGWTPEKKQAAIDEFMKDPKKKVIIGNILTLGTGFNITKADIVYFNSPDWNGGEHEQAEGRTWRIGRKDEVRVYYQLFENTVEEDVMDRAESKKENTAIFLGEEFEDMDDF